MWTIKDVLSSHRMILLGEIAFNYNNIEIFLLSTTSGWNVIWYVILYVVVIYKADDNHTAPSMHNAGL